MAEGVVGLEDVQYVGVLPGPTYPQVNVSDARISPTRLDYMTPQAPPPPKSTLAKGTLRPSKSKSSCFTKGGGAAQQEETVWQWNGDGNEWTNQMPEVSRAIEEAHQAKKNSVTCTIRGKPYVIDLKRNVQYMQTTPHAKRKVRRVEGSNSQGGGLLGAVGAVAKGVGGLLGSLIGAVSPHGGGAAAVPVTPGLFGAVACPPTPTPLPPAVPGGECLWQWKNNSGWEDFPAAAQLSINDAVSKGLSTAIVDGGGRRYVVDLAKKVQYQQDDPSRQRKIRPTPLLGGAAVVPAAPGLFGAAACVPAPTPLTPLPAPPAPSAVISRWQWKNNSGWEDFPPAAQLTINDAVLKGLPTAIIDGGGRKYVVDLAKRVQYQGTISLFSHVFFLSDVYSFIFLLIFVSSPPLPC